MNSNSNIRIDSKGLWVDGEYRVMLCASLFYFRIPQELWKDRIVKIKKAGYNCVDVYFPWNFHELSPGEWDFYGERDVVAFLRLLAEEEMYVVARPGPYICSEWDGGALPAWVLNGDAPLREAHPEFLAQVDAWYSRILPLIADYQCGSGGSVILVQLDNELDFFDCMNPKAYMGALRDMAVKYGIEVPLFGCAGQGSAERATGFAADVEIAYNFYPDSKDPSFDFYCHTAYLRMQGLGKPLMITETNRDPFMLRRQLSCGASLLGPYNQVAGTNFGFTSSINNWGNGEQPLALIASDYNFASHVSPVGEYDENVLESKLLSNLLNAFGSRLAKADARMDHGFFVKSAFTGPQYGNHALDLNGQGWLLCVPNFDNCSGRALIEGRGVNFEAMVGPGQAPFFPIGICLEPWGICGEIKWASAEISHIICSESEVHFILYSDGEGKACFVLPEAKYAESGKDLGGGMLLLEGLGARFELFQSNKRILLSIVDRESAARLLPDGSCWQAKIPGKRKAAIFEGGVGLFRNVPLWDKEVETKDVASLEKHGLWRGFGQYRFFAQAGNPILLKEAADILSVYEENKFIDTRISGGQWQRYEGRFSGDWKVRCEIWGHSNFDDSRLPSLQLKSCKGITGAYEILQEEKIYDGWAFDYFDGDPREALKRPLNGFEPLISLNSWNTTRIPTKALYRRKIVSLSGVDSLILHMEGNRALAEVFINRRSVGRINPLDPYLELSQYIQPGVEAEIAIVAVKKDWNEPVGIPKLLNCKSIHNYSLALLSDKKVPAICNHETYPASLPIRFKQGEVSLVSLKLDEMKPGCAYGVLTGGDVKATVVFNDHVIGRIFLPGEVKPCLKGGDPLRVYIPEPWFEEKNNKLNILVEAIGTNPYIGGFTMEYVEKT